MDTCLERADALRTQKKAALLRLLAMCLGMKCHPMSQVRAATIETVEGGRRGRVVLVQHQDIDDPETGGSYTVKRYVEDLFIDRMDQNEDITARSINPRRQVPRYRRGR